MAVTLPERLKVNDMIIVDADVHVNDTPGALAPYCDMPWRKSLESLDRRPAALSRHPRLRALAQARPADPRRPCRPLRPLGGGDARVALRALHRCRHALPGQPPALRADPEYRVRDRPLPCLQPLADGGVADARAGIVRRARSPARRTRRTRRARSRSTRKKSASSPSICRRRASIRSGATGSTIRSWRRRRRRHLPVLLHSVTVISPQPSRASWTSSRTTSRGRCLSHSFAMMANLVSMMHTGVMARYPKLKVAFTEAGVAWVPYFMWRMDRYHEEYRRTVPFLEKRPSEYMKERMWFATQPARGAGQPAASRGHHPHVRRREPHPLRLRLAAPRLRPPEVHHEPADAAGDEAQDHGRERPRTLQYPGAGGEDYVSSSE